MPAGAIIGGLTLGLAGSLHCVGMCGPLSLALPTARLSPAHRFISLLLYQIGRIVTYSTIGLVFGWAGRGLFIAGYQQVFSIVAGAAVIVFAVLYFLNRFVWQVSFFNRIFSPVQSIIGNLLRKAKGPSGFFVMGMANGLLPCGMVYIALLTTLSFPQVTQSIIFMASFGAGTLPLMMLTAYAGHLIRGEARLKLRKAVPLLVMAVGILLVMRGLNLGIPFVSPHFESSVPGVVDCHPANP